MRINNQPLPPLPIDSTTDTTASKRATAGGLSGAKPEDVVNISQAAKELSAIGTASLAGASRAELTRQHKIAALKRSIHSGTYRVEPDKVAKAIISELAATRSTGKDVK